MNNSMLTIALLVSYQLVAMEDSSNLNNNSQNPKLGDPVVMDRAYIEERIGCPLEELPIYPLMILWRDDIECQSREDDYCREFTPEINKKINELIGAKKLSGEESRLLNAFDPSLRISFPQLPALIRIEAALKKQYPMGDGVATSPKIRRMKYINELLRWDISSRLVADPEFFKALLIEQSDEPSSPRGSKKRKTG